jgi:hypothetical protein
MMFILKKNFRTVVHNIGEEDRGRGGGQFNRGNQMISSPFEETRQNRTQSLHPCEIHRGEIHGLGGWGGWGGGQRKNGRILDS